MRLQKDIGEKLIEEYKNQGYAVYTHIDRSNDHRIYKDKQKARGIKEKNSETCNGCGEDKKGIFYLLFDNQKMIYIPICKNCFDQLDPELISTIKQMCYLNSFVDWKKFDKERERKK